MTLLTTRCPECRANVRSPKGFTAGQTVCCPKCETYFTFEEPEDGADAPTGKKPIKAALADDDDPTPRKKRKAYDEDEEPVRSYKDSPLRYAILGVLVVTMLVLGYFLVQKWKGEREMARADNDSARAADEPPVLIPPPPEGPVAIGGPARGPRAKLPNPKGVNPKGARPVVVPPPAPVGNALGGFLGGAPVLAPEKRDELVQEYKTALVGTWAADLGAGVREELTYSADGTFAAKRTGAEPATASGKYTVAGLVGTKSLKIQLNTADGPRNVVAVFEDGELQHPSLQKGVTGVFRKK